MFQIMVTEKLLVYYAVPLGMSVSAHVRELANSMLDDQCKKSRGSRERILTAPFPSSFTSRLLFLLDSRGGGGKRASEFILII